VEKKEVKLQHSFFFKSQRSGIKNLSLPGKRWSEWNLHLNPNLTAKELDAIIFTILTYAPPHPLLNAIKAASKAQ